MLHEFFHPGRDLEIFIEMLLAAEQFKPSWPRAEAVFTSIFIGEPLENKE